MSNPSHSYGVSYGITRVSPASQVGTRFTYLGGIEGWVDLDVGLLVHRQSPIQVVTTW